MFEQAFKNIDDVLWKEAGCTTELDYTEQTSWLLFLKYLDDLEQDKSTEAALQGKKYSYMLDEPYRKGKGSHQHALQQQAASLSGLRSGPLCPRRRRGVGSGEAYALVTAQVSQLHCRRPGRLRTTGRDWAGFRRAFRSISISLRLARDKAYPRFEHCQRRLDDQVGRFDGSR